MNNIQVSFTVRELVLLRKALLSYTSDLLEGDSTGRPMTIPEEIEYRECLRLQDRMDVLTGVVPEVREA